MVPSLTIILQRYTGGWAARLQPEAILVVCGEIGYTGWRNRVLARRSPPCSSSYCRFCMATPVIRRNAVTSGSFSDHCSIGLPLIRLAGSRAHRARVVKDQDLLAGRQGPHPRSAGASDPASPDNQYRSGRPRLVHLLRLYRTVI